MNLIDLLIFLFALILGARGFYKGFVREGLEAASALGGVFVAYYAYGELGNVATVYTGIPFEVTRPVVFVAIAVAVTAGGFLVTACAHRAIPRRGLLSTVDGLGGLGFGVLKGVFYASLALVLVAQAPIGAVTRALDNSAFSRAVFAMLPEIYQHVDGLVDQAEEATPGTSFQ